MSRNRKELKKSDRRKMELIRKKKRTKNLLLISVLFIVTIGLVVCIGISMGNSLEVENVISKEDSIYQTENEIRIPLLDIDSKVSFYTYNANGVEIRYFAVKGSDDEIHVAADACDVCYDANKGYRQIGNVMSCINCGKEFPINSIGTENVAGGCWPSYLPIEVIEDSVIIKISDLESKKYMF